jgi:hypothetical protein
MVAELKRIGVGRQQRIRGFSMMMMVREPLAKKSEFLSPEGASLDQRWQYTVRPKRPEPAGVLKLEPLCGATAFAPMLFCSRVACARLGLIFTSQILRPL